MGKTLKRDLTDEQKNVVNSDALKIKVSANAGSGKTFTIMQRIAQIITIGKSKLDELLVLTFTDASAQDMRKKLKEQLGNLVSPVDLQAATIGTFHSFCARIVRAWFTVAEVSPSFAVMDEIESTKMKSTIFEQVVLANYQDVAAAVDLFAANRNLDELREVIFKIHSFLTTRENREEWLQTTALAAYETNLDQNPAVQKLMAYYRELASKYRHFMIQTGGPKRHLDALVDATNRIIAAKTYDDFRNLVFNFPQAKKGDFNDADDFKALRTDFRDNVCKNITKQFQFSTTEIQNDLVADRRVVEQLLKLVQIFDGQYQAKKAEYKQLDYDDLEKYALKVLDNTDALNAIRAQFKYIFVDEGQDTNPIQFKIIDILRGDDKFFCIVGDVKQSIYGFRDCEPENFAQMKDQNGTLLPALLLGKNFRSASPILHFVNAVMQPLSPDYEEFTLIGQPDFNAMQQVVSIDLTPKLEAQMELVYQQILRYQATMQADDDEKKGLQEIAILSETGTHFEKLQKYLAERGVASVIDRDTNALHEPEVCLLNHFLFAAMNPTNELARYLVLQYFFHCSNDDLARLRLEKLNPTLSQKIADCDAILAKYRCLGRAVTTYEILTQVATEFGMLEMPVVNAFLSAVRGVRDFDTVARYLYLIEHQLVTIQINVGAYTKDAVKLMTVHHSKGLEFSYVILFNFGTKWSQQHNDSGKIALDKNLGICVASVDTENFVHKSPVLRLGIVKYQQDRALEEKKRLLYVALTRAKKRMAIIGNWQENQFMIRPNSMLDLILFQPHQFSWLKQHDEVKISAPQVTNRVSTQSQITLCPKVGCPDNLVKQSVTALATTAEPFQDYIAPMKFTNDGGKEFGTKFHRQVQYGDLPEQVQQLVDGYTVYRELPFLYVQNQTIVQGIMDLLAVKDNEAIIVDYKTTRLPRAELIKRYQEQLRLYAQAIPNYHVRTYIYSTVHSALIEVCF